tara:strand:- start:253 stop:903 length:651 start_codon:yes stop_codon:yes gene_type:complete
MAQTDITIGVANQGDGDTLFTAFTAVQANFTELYGAYPPGDITGVTAGDGLTGGGTSGNVTLTLGVDDSTIEINSDAARIKDLGVTTAKLANDGVTHAKLENRYTASGSITTYAGAVTVNWSAATNFVMGSSLTGAIEFDFTDFKTGQVLTIHNLTGSQTITLDSNATTSETFNKLGAKDYDGSATNALMIECISDSANAVFNYSVLTYVSDTTPS